MANIPPLPPPPGIPRTNSNGTPTQAQIDYERKLSAWVQSYTSSLVTGIPFPSPTTLGGVLSATAPTHKFQRGIDTGGNPLFAQPSAGDISGLGSLATASTVAVGSITGLGALATQSTVDLVSQATGNLGVSHFNSGIDASSSKFWRGDGIWASPSSVPGGSSGQVQFNNAGSFGGFTLGGDGTLDVTTGALIVTKTNGVAFATVATSASASDLTTGTLPNARLSAVPNSALANSAISGVSLGGNLNALTIGTHLTGTSYNGSAGVTIATDATNTNTASTIVARDASGNFTAGTITASLTGHASADLQAANNLSDLASAKTARSSTGLNIESGTGHGDSNYTILSTDRWVYTNANFTAPRTWTLPAASSLNAGQSIIIDDLQNTLTAANTLIVSRAGSDLINALSSLTLNVAGMRCVLISDGTSKWTATLGLTGVTGTGSIALSASPTFSGTAVFSTISAATAGITTATIPTLHSTTFDATTATIGTLIAPNVSGAFAKLTNTTGTGQLSLSGTGLDNGGYVLGYGTNTLALTGGTLFDGTNWIAKATTINSIGLTGGVFGFYSDSGLTIGNTFTPTIRFGWDATGTLTTGTVPIARITGAAASGANSDITSLTGITGAIKSSVTPSAAWALDCTGCSTGSIAASGTYTLQAGAGLLVLDDISTTGQVAVFLVGTTIAPVLIAQTSTAFANAVTANKYSLTYNGSGSYVITNSTASAATFNIGGIRTRTTGG